MSIKSFDDLSVIKNIKKMSIKDFYDLVFTEKGNYLDQTRNLSDKMSYFAGNLMQAIKDNEGVQEVKILLNNILEDYKIISKLYHANSNNSIKRKFNTLKINSQNVPDQEVWERFIFIIGITIKNYLTKAAIKVLSNQKPLDDNQKNRIKYKINKMIDSLIKEGVMQGNISGQLKEEIGSRKFEIYKYNILCSDIDKCIDTLIANFFNVVESKELPELPTEKADTLNQDAILDLVNCDHAYNRQRVADTMLSATDLFNTKVERKKKELFTKSLQEDLVKCLSTLNTISIKKSIFGNRTIFGHDTISAQDREKINTIIATLQKKAKNRVLSPEEEKILQLTAQQMYFNPKLPEEDLQKYKKFLSEEQKFLQLDKELKYFINKPTEENLTNCKQLVQDFIDECESKIQNFTMRPISMLEQISSRKQESDRESYEAALYEKQIQSLQNSKMLTKYAESCLCDLKNIVIKESIFGKNSMSNEDIATIRRMIEEAHHHATSNGTRPPEAKKFIDLAIKLQNIINSPSKNALANFENHLFDLNWQRQSEMASVGAGKIKR